LRGHHHQRGANDCNAEQGDRQGSLHERDPVSHPLNLSCHAPPAQQMCGTRPLFCGDPRPVTVSLGSVILYESARHTRRFSHCSRRCDQAKSPNA
jgi:hypothetical protein